MLTTDQIRDIAQDYVNTNPLMAFQNNRMNNIVIGILDNMDQLVIGAGGEPTIAAGTTSQYWRGDKSWQALNATAVGLSNVPNINTTNAANLSSGLIPAARYGTATIPIAAIAATGTASSSTVLFGNGTWGVPAPPDNDMGDITISGGGTVWTINDDAITLSMLPEISANRVLGRILPGTGDVAELTGDDITPLLTVFSAGLQGVVPLSGGGTVNFLRADGIWAAPAGSGGVSDGDKGDIVVSAGGATWTIDSLAVTNSKINDVAWSKITGAPSFTVDATVINGSANAVSGNAVYDELQLKQNTITTGTTAQYLRGDLSLATFPTISGTNTGDVTLAGQTYLTIAGQVITANAVNLSGTHVTGTLAAARIAGTATDGYLVTLVGGVPTWAAGGSTYSDENAQDAVGGMINSTLTYTDATPLLSINLNNANTWTADISVPDEAYGVGWDGSMEVPTKNALYDKIETLVAGTGSVNSGTANRLAYYPSGGTTVDDLNAITASRALVSDTNGLPTHSTVTTTELGYVSGVTSAIQTQIDGTVKLNSVNNMTDISKLVWTENGAEGPQIQTGLFNWHTEISRETYFVNNATWVAGAFTYATTSSASKMVFDNTGSDNSWSMTLYNSASAGTALSSGVVASALELNAGGLYISLGSLTYAVQMTTSGMTFTGLTDPRIAFGADSGTPWGIQSIGGVMSFRNSGGSWIPIPTSGGGGSGTVSSGTQYRLSYYGAAGTTVSELAAITANRAIISDANGLPTHSTVTNTELGYVSGVTSAIQTQIELKPRVFNVKSYGATGDGIHGLDGAITSGDATFTSASASFVVGDIGKVIKVTRAGASGADLVTTIASINSSTSVELADNAGSTVSAIEYDYGTDQTAAFRAARDAAFTAGGGTVYIPNGIYILSSAVETSLTGTNPNAQIGIPYAAASGVGRTHVRFQGETQPQFSPSAWGSDVGPSHKGTVLLSVVRGTGIAPGVFGSAGLVAQTDFNYNYVSFKDLTILVLSDPGNNGPSMGGISMAYGGPINTDNVLVCMDGSIFNSAEPTNECAGIIANIVNGEAMSTIRNTLTVGFRYGIVAGDHTVLDHAQAFSSVYGLVATKNFQPISSGRVNIHWSKHGLYIPSSTILGIPAGVTYMNISVLNVEQWNTGGGQWWEYVSTINDAGNFGRGDVVYSVAESFVGVNNALYTLVGGTDAEFKLRQLGASVIGSVPSLQQVTDAGLQTNDNILVRNDQNGDTKLTIQNATAGASAQATFRLVNDSDFQVIQGIYSTSRTPYGAIAAGMGWFYSNSPTGLSFMADDVSAPLVFAANGNTETFRATTLSGISYLNFGGASGSTDYGFRNNSGVMEWKNSGGSWAAIASGGGGSSQWTTSGTSVYYADPVVIGTAAAAPAGTLLHIKKDQAAPTLVLAENATTSTAASTIFRAKNDAAELMQMGLYSSTTTDYGAILASSGFLYGTGAGGMVFMQDLANSPIIFAAGGNTETFRMALSSGINYLNFSNTSGSTGYGIRNNGGSVEVKHSGGSWAAIGSGTTTTTLQFAQISDVTVSNIIGGQSILGTLAGSNSITGSTITAGTVMKIKGSGEIGTGAGNRNIEFTLAIANYAIQVVIADLPASATGLDYNFEAEFIPRAAGSGVAGGVRLTFIYENTTLGAVKTVVASASHASQFDTTGTLSAQVAIEWDIADTSNTITSHTNTLEIFRP